MRPMLPAMPTEGPQQSWLLWILCQTSLCSTSSPCQTLYHMQVVSEALLEPSKGMAAARNASHHHSYLTYPLRYDLFPKDMADLAKANSIRAMAIGFKVLAAMTDMVIGNQQLLQVPGWGSWGGPCCSSMLACAGLVQKYMPVC